ncbi:MAG: DUF4256 domain-containing protein [Niabella sp.]
MVKIIKKDLSLKQREEILEILKSRFGKNMHRHEGIDWKDVQERLTTSPDKLWSLHRMEETGGEPDVIAYRKDSGEYVFCDCCAESPKGRRSICYDRDGLLSRKEHRPENSAVDMAADMGIELLTEDEYRTLQQLENFDAKTSSWLKAPDDIRILGGAIFGDFRYGKVFIYHNGAQSYYSSRGFRGMLRV